MGESGVTTVERSDDAGFGNPSPKGIELFQEWRDRVVGNRDGCGAHADDASAVIEGPFQFGDRRVEIDQAEVGRGEEPAAIRKTPVLVEPAIERAEGSDDRTRVVQQRLLHPDTESRE